MFAVPGWNLSTLIATQTETLKPKDPSKVGKKAQKRKQRQEEQVNAENLVEQWERTIEAKNAEVKSRQDSSHVGEEALGDDSQEKRGKKRKRGKAGGRKDKQEVEDGAKTEINAPASGPNAEAVGQKVPPEKLPVDTDRKSNRDKKKRKKDSTADPTSTSAPLLLPSATADLIPEPKGLTPLQKSMRTKLASARFRHLNESLYTKPSADSLSLFRADPSMFADYHRGFAQQVDVWPENPVDEYVADILSRGKQRIKDPWKEKQRAQKKSKGTTTTANDAEAENSTATDAGMPKPLPRNIHGHCTIADLGCGTASLSYRLHPHSSPLALTLHAFDLARPPGPSAPLVTVADIARLPLSPGSIDVAIFCLALMGTNWLDFIDEAYRVMRWRGELWVAEIKSRFGRVDGKRSVPVNSVGSLRKGGEKTSTGANKKKKKGGIEEEETNDADEAELAVAVDGAAQSAGTDVTAFVAVLRRRGFVLDAPPERPGDAIDLRNKMFVKMRFIKAAHPSLGKNAPEDQKAGAGARPIGLKMGMKGKKFGVVGEQENEAMEAEKESKVLKPCLYKVR